ncbi:MAG: arginine N-succinyltransferase [Polyangiaceae bacterium]|nr:arginine N-succinyltransferase [Polyangiaceae bacterium]
MPRYEIRASHPGDEAELLAVARHLNTVNLPHDHAAIVETVALSDQSFRGALASPLDARYLFVLVDREASRIIGTSMIIAQLGQRGAPYIFLDVLDEEKYAGTLDLHFHHTLLRIGYSYNGPTEIGGLVLSPDYRRVPERLGLMLSYVRFLFMAMHRDRFRDEVLAELLPPLEPDGTSHLWEALGRRFTGMSYVEADLLSKSNKEFIKGLFPREVMYATLMSPDAQAVIGKVGAQTKGVEKMLRRIGFRYAYRVDPFDGGPHFTAPMDEITLVAHTRRLSARAPLSPAREDVHALVAVESPLPPFFRAVRAAVRDAPDGVLVEEAAWQHLGLAPGDGVAVLGLDERHEAQRERAAGEHPDGAGHLADGQRHSSAGSDRSSRS